MKDIIQYEDSGEGNNIRVKEARRKILLAQHQSRFAREAEVEQVLENEQDIKEFLQDLSLLEDLQKEELSVDSI